MLVSCGEKDPSFSLFSESDVFYQTVTNKLDILWVMDNSGSMQNLQTNVANNFNSFISDFVDKNYDFQIAVTTTDTWRAPYINPNLAKFRDGADGNNSGVFVITPETPNVIQTFITNITQGVNGGGDERAFQSFKEALSSPLNAGFVRDDGFLAVIIVSDEEDFSHSGTNHDDDYNNPNLYPVQDYEDYLDTLTNSTGASRRYSVSSISIWDTPCLNANTPWGRIGIRYGELVDATNGEKGDVCSSDFASTLDDIQTKIAELSTQFYLSREPVVSTIEVWVNGNPILEDADNGWTYDPVAVSLVFHGTSIPSQGAQILVDFDPVTVIE